MAAVKLLTIDATNTVIKIRGGVGGMYKHVAHKLRMEALSTTPAALIDSSFKNSFRLHWSKAPNFGYGKMTPTDWWRDVTRGTILALTQLQPNEEAHFCNSLHETFSTATAYEPVEGALETLQGLSQKVDIVVITNNDSRVRQVLGEMLGPDLIKRYIISNEEGVCKPDERIFTKALNEMGVAADEALHVGDSYNNDYLPAVSLGMQALLYTPTNSPPTVECQTIADIKQLLEYV